VSAIAPQPAKLLAKAVLSLYPRSVRACRSACFRVLFIALPVLTAAGCAPRDAGFSTVKTDVHARIGHTPRYRDVEGDEDADTTRQIQTWLATPLDADRAVQIALLRNPRLQAAFSRLGVARAGLLGASLLPNPELEVELEFPQGDGSLHWTFAATESLTGLIALPLRRAQASADLARSQVQAAADALDVAYQTRRAFYACQAAEQELAIVRDVVTVASLTSELLKRLHDAGNVTELDVAEARAFEENARLVEATAEQLALDARAALWQWLGGPRTPAELRVGEHLPEIPAELPALASLESHAVARSLDLRRLDAERDFLERSASAAQLQGVLPELRAGVVAERDHGEWEVGPMAAVALPLFNQGQARVAASEAAQRGVYYERQARVLSIRSAAHTLRGRLERAAERVRRYASELLPLRHSIVDQTLRQYNAMQIGVRELLFARTQELDASRAYIAAQRSYWLLRADLDQLLAGRLMDDGRATGETIGSVTPPASGGAIQGDH
jgi:cobalt-zinc-cadmium efflux system outer membrane protein